MMGIIFLLAATSPIEALCYPPAKAANIASLKSLIERDLLSQYSQIDRVGGTATLKNETLDENINNHQVVVIDASYTIDYSYKKETNEMCGSIVFTSEDE
tara:strand:+ start:1518 stop:1817 length:300 start_codon:yes stop_codon:yes gene_type:complete